MKRLVLLSFIVVIFLSSCQLKKLTMEVYTPATLIFPPEVRSVLVTSRFVPATGPYEDMQWGAYESVDSLLWECSESIVDTIASRMARDNSFLVKPRHYPRMLRHNEGTLPEPLPWEGMASLAKQEYVQSILVIEGFDISKNEEIIKTQQPGFLKQVTLDVTLAIRIYETEKMRMLDDSVYTFSSILKGEGSSLEEASGKLPDDRTAMLIACSNAADEYYRMIKPGEMTVARMYYPDGDSSMVKADIAIKDGKWGRAESTWKWLAYNSPDTTIQAKASFNMALMCERDGRFNQAIGFARRSQRLMPDKRTDEYISILNKRMNDIEEQVTKKQIIKKW
jgi:hypothetical protein